VIISNPPFYQGELSSPSSIKNIAHHDEGLLAEELLKIIRHHLDKNGRFFLLLPFKRFAELTAGCSLNNLFISKIIKIRSFNDGPVSRFMVEGGLMQTTMETSEINIYGMNKEYSNEFKELLAPFYLNL
jgi:tRNA1Val (adenine37-N6)-methyltransferase